MQPVGIEPTSEALQAPAMTTSAKVALVPRTRIELVINGYQPFVIPFNYPGILGRGDWIRTSDDDFKDRCLRPD